MSISTLLQHKTINPCLKQQFVNKFDNLKKEGKDKDLQTKCTDVSGHILNEAKMHLERALSLDKMNKDALCEMARVQYQLRDMKLAYKFVNEAIRADEQYFLPYYVKGMILLAAGDTVKAVSSLQTSVELNPDYYDGFIQIGELYDGERNALALDYYNSAISIQAKNPLEYYYKAMFLQNTEQLEEAYLTYDQILAIDSTYKFAYYNQGYICLEYLEEYEIGIERFTKAIELDKNYFSAFYNRGLCYENMGQKTKAEADYKLALSIKPNYDLAALGLSRLLEK